MKKTILTLSAALFLFILTIGIHGYQYTYTPLQQPGREIVLRISPGQNFSDITRNLEQKGLVQNSWKFKILGRLSGLSKAMQAGEFRINTQWTRIKLLRYLHKGRVILHELRIPEGLTWWETAQEVQRQSFASFQEVESSITNEQFLQEMHIPATTAEGFLFPDTYRLEKSMHNQAQEVVRTMLEEFWKKADTHLWPNQRPSAEELMRVVTLASLVEKETGRDQERARIAGVYVNRLQKGMRLQCDPTVIYGLGSDFNGNLTKEDLRDKGNKYNTYIYAGLPPGPICSPGLASLQAAMHPEKHDYLYFVAKGDGSHQFSRTLSEHNRAVRKYQLAR